MRSNLTQVRLLARDLTREYPRSPRDTFAGDVLAARCVDKCRELRLEFAGIAPALKTFVPTHGAP